MKRKYPMVVSLILLMTIASCYLLGIMINITPSIKEGIYIKILGKIERNDTVAFCLSDPYKTLGLKHGYLYRGLKCKGANPLIKKIIALPGDNVALTNRHLIVNHIKYPYKTRYQDSMHRKLDTFPRGNYQKTKGYWMIGSHDPNSWDSRYWGPVNQTAILYKLKPLLTW